MAETTLKEKQREAGRRPAHVKAPGSRKKSSENAKTTIGWQESRIDAKVAGKLQGRLLRRANGMQRDRVARND